MNFKYLDDFLARAERERLPFCEAAVTLKGECVYEKGHIGSNAYMAYSLTKPLVCACALTLFERGFFTLDDKLSDFIPEFSDMRVVETLPGGEKRLRPAKRGIEIRDLFTMTAGFGYDVRLLFDAPTLTVVRRLADKPLLFDPGEHWNYSLCHDVLGAVIEIITGKRLSAFVRESIFEPLGMADTYFQSELADTSVIAPLFDAKSGCRVPVDTRFTPGRLYDSGGAGIVTTLRDYSAFCAALVEERVLNNGTLSLMRSDHLNDATRRDFNWGQVRGYGYGLGVRTLTDPVKAGSPSPIGEFGWGGITGAYSLMDAERGLSFVFLTHSLGTDEVWLFPRLRNVLYACL